MSLFSYPNGREAPFKFILPAATQTLYTAGDNGATVVALKIAEVALATPTVTLDVYNGTTAYEIAHLKAFTAKEIWEAIQLDSVPVVLLPGETLRATASAASQLHATGVVIEPDQRA
jgi:hypothetical protein